MNPDEFRLDMLAAAEIAITIAGHEPNPEAAEFLVLLASRLNGYSKQAARETPAQIAIPHCKFQHSKQ